MIPSPPFALRPLAPDDLPGAHALSQAVRWPHRLEDWRITFALGQGLAAVDAEGRLAGVALWWTFGDRLATLGTVIVSPEVQRAGIGRRLLEAIVAAAGSRAIRLNATAEGLRLYESLGFAAAGGIRQHQGMPAAGLVPTATEAEIRPLAEADRPAVLDLDRRASGDDRTAMIQVLDALSTGLVARRDGRLVGYALCRDFGRGRLVGPVVAESEATALALVSRHVAEAPGFLRVDIPDDAETLSAWLAGAGLAGVDRVRAMLKGTPPDEAPDARIFGLASQAMG